MSSRHPTDAAATAVADQYDATTRDAADRVKLVGVLLGSPAPQQLGPQHRTGVARVDAWLGAGLTPGCEHARIAPGFGILAEPGRLYCPTCGDQRLQVWLDQHPDDCDACGLLVVDGWFVDVILQRGPALIPATVCRPCASLLTSTADLGVTRRTGRERE